MAEQVAAPVASMSRLARACRAVLVQGFTGGPGRRSARLMREYGTEVVGGVVPGRGGTEVDGVPLFDTVAALRDAHGSVPSSLISVAPQRTEAAAIEAIDAGCDVVVLRAERIPHQAMLRVVERARRTGTLLIGGNSLGVLVPDVGRIGNLGGEVAFARRVFTPGQVAVISRSGGNTGTLGWYLSSAGVGQSCVISMGGDAVPGSSLLDLLLLLEDDPSTRAVAYYGEVGTTQEEVAAAAIRDGRVTKPLVAHIAGRHTRPGVRYGHAGAFIATGSGDEGSVVAKERILRAAGAHVVEHLDDIPDVVRSVLADGRR